MTAKKKVKKIVSKGKKLSRKKLQKGTVGNFFVFGVLALLMVLGITAVGGLPSQMAPTSGQVVLAITPTPGATHDNLQLKWFGYVTIVPTPIPSKNSLCNDPSKNTEKTILLQYSPGPGQTTGTNGQIKVWVNDEYAPFVSLGEKVDAKGNVTAHGDVNAKSIDDRYSYEPALYLDTPVEQGGSPYYPDIIKGNFNNNPPVMGAGQKIVNYDAIPPGGGFPDGPNPNGNLPNIYTAEFIWNVSGLGLSSGTHQAEFLIHDGDHERGIGCVSIQIQ